MTLDSIEGELRQAASMGQALLARHEAYMADAEQDRRALTTTIERLEADKQGLEAENARTIEENHSLLNQLEDINNNVADSDVHIKALQTTLESTRQELTRLSLLASRTADLEAQLSALELEQAQLQQTVITSEKQERSAIQRWQRAEQAVIYLEEQIQRIEKEAQEERQRHVEIVGRLERRRAVERELESAAGRLKSAAAATTMDSGKNGTNVVSHFVKDILQDNAHLQTGIVELREMLQSSNEEVQHLRDQLLLHQPVVTANDDGVLPTSLSKELEPAPASPSSQQLHVHHHYHVAEKSNEKTQLRRPKRKRNTVSRGLLTSPTEPQSPLSPYARQARPGASSTATTILSQTTTSIPFGSSPPSNRWSMQSTQTRSSTALSSIPSSPQSIYRYSSIFDRTLNDNVMDSSRPTSPESIDPMSPIIPARQKLSFKGSSRSLTTPMPFHLKSASSAPAVTTLNTLSSDDEHAIAGNMSDLDLGIMGPSIIPEETEDFCEGELPHQGDGFQDLDKDDRPPLQPLQSLRRAASHESLLSVSGMDIHTLRDRPSQLTLTGGGFSSRAPLSITTTSGPTVGSQPVLSATTATARPSLGRREFDSSTYNRSLLQGRQGGPTADRNSSSRTAHDKVNLGQRVGGWVWGKWGVKPMASSGDLRAKASVGRARERTPGVNQIGAIMGLPLPPKVPSQVRASVVNENLLREALQE
ncbi:MAG: hypothetical protein M1833_005609 [Piccolia ochrophora]|nr:MAG: hypothetical protein M1833_005609 [Piccolia ochrophora]